MAPSDSQGRHTGNQGRQASRRHGRMSDTATSQRHRNDDSWVEIASQPSSSSLSSIGDEIITTGLRVGNNSYPPRRRRLHQVQQNMPATYLINQSTAQAGTSSQEEYDETESEEDRIMTSSNEQPAPATSSLPRQQTAVGPTAAVEVDSDEGDDDENATALGRPSNSPTFRPQPNAFSHPPSHLTHRHSTNSSISHEPPFPRPSMSQRAQTRVHRGGAPSFMSPSYEADNDAALRASLTTLLSCAAAARGLPKKDAEIAAGHPSSTGGVLSGSSQPMDIRLVPETELMGAGPGSSMAAQPPSATAVIPPRLRHQQPPPARTASNSSAPSAPSTNSSRERKPAAAAAAAMTADKAKRPSASTSQPKSPRATKKRMASDTTNAAATSVESANGTTFISPSVLTWVVSAGVLVLVSVVGFGAGYVIGREVGRQEGMSMSLSGSGITGNASSCGTELVKSTTSAGTLRRFRWSAVGRSITA